MNARQQHFQRLSRTFVANTGLKSSFMPGFEKVAAGDGPPREPTFKERIAKKPDQHAVSD